MKKLDDLKIADRTVIVFTSDNGGLLRITGNAPLRAGKGSPWEGGTRVPLIVVWPGAVKPGSECSTPVISVDFYPTILEMAGVKGDRQHNAAVDGKSLVPLLRQSGAIKRDAIYWHYPHYHPGGAMPYGAVRKGDYKLIEFYEDRRVELYNLKKDLGEKENLAEKMPKKVAELGKLLDQWLEKVDAQLPEENPDFNPVRDGRPGTKPPPKEPAEEQKEAVEEPKKPPEPKTRAEEPKKPAEEAKEPAAKE
jgi:arylsulfatase A-like enzyme